ncbi:MAG: type II toxin-antitoxin system HicA family toxin [Anaerolineae bacterium]|nr:type II toxin-antitoxin system HicA family toxin [Anaerolineae bacterium]
MTRLPSISGRECMRALEKVGFVAIRQKGSHVFMRRDDPFAQTVVPDHSEIRRGTLRNILRQAGLTVDEFIALL